MTITAAQVNELRIKTGAGMMDCKKALTEAEGDFDKAIEILRKKGAAVAAKRADRSANEGVVLNIVSDDKKKGTIIEVNCETDFVAKSDDFLGFSDLVLNRASAGVFNTVEESLENEEIKIKLDELVGKIGEKIVVGRVANVEVENGMVINYTHPGSKLGVLVLFENIANDLYNSFSPVAKDIAMQVAAMKPITTYREEVDKTLIEKELEIYKEIARKEGKPEQILEKIATGKLTKFYQENCLFEQAYIKDNAKTIADLVSEFNKANNSQVKILKFLRFQLGEDKK